MKRTPLYDTHVALGARIVEFGGWQMPVWYDTLISEHQAVRERVGLFDVSHMGEFYFAGAGALPYLRRMLTNDAADLEVGQAHYTLMPNERGGTVDDLLLYRISPEEYLMVVNAANIDKDRSWLEGHLDDDVLFEDRSDATALLALQGPRAFEVLAKITDAALDELEYYYSIDAPVAGALSMISRTGYTGEDGFEIMVEADQAQQVWDATYEAGGAVGLSPAGLGARDSLRLEAAMALYGNELDEDTSALEAGLGYFVKLDKPEMMGMERLRREREQGVSRKLVGLKCTDRGVPRHGFAILADGTSVGEVTSGTLSPTLGYPIAMGYVAPDFAAVGTELAIDIRGRQVRAEVIKRPFYRRSKKT